MQIVSKSEEGLSRVFGVTVEASELTAKLNAKIAEIAPGLKLKGFRPGKVPAEHVKRLYGKSLMGEIVEQAVTDSQAQALNDNGLRPAAQPDVKVSSNIEAVLAGQCDLAFDVEVELMPDFQPARIDDIALERPVYAPADADVEAELKEIADQSRTYADKAGEEPAAQEGDMVVADFVGRIDGEPFEGGSAEDSEIVIGSGRFIPGFEDQLKGAAPGADVKVQVTFPQDYGVQILKGKAATFDVKVKAVRAPVDRPIDDDFAKTLGLDTADALREAVRAQLSGRYARASRFRAKRALLDALDTRHDFPLPPRMVEAEFASIWAQVEQEKASGELSEEDAGKTDEQLRAEYRKIAERRVRLGLVLAEIGRAHAVQVTDQELAEAMRREAMRYGAQAQQVFDSYRQRTDLQAQLRAPIYEEKVVDLILAKAQVEDKPVSKDELFADDELPEAYQQG